MHTETEEITKDVYFEELPYVVFINSDIIGDKPMEEVWVQLEKEQHSQDGKKSYPIEGDKFYDDTTLAIYKVTNKDTTNDYGHRFSIIPARIGGTVNLKSGGRFKIIRPIKLKYIESLTEKDINKIIRAICWPDFNDEEFIAAANEKWMERFRSSHANEGLKFLSKIFPHKNIHEISWTTPESRQKFVEDTSTEKLV